jgi:hypothetical protein
MRYIVFQIKLHLSMYVSDSWKLASQHLKLYCDIIIIIITYCNWVFSFHSVAVVLTLVQTKQIIYINETIQNTVNISTRIIKTPTHNKTDTYTHQHITKQVKTTIAQNTNHMK